MDILRKFSSLSDSEYTAKFQRLCGISYESCNYDHNGTLNAGLNRNVDQVELRKRKECGRCQQEFVNNNISGKPDRDFKKGVARTPKTEVERLWKKFSAFQKFVYYLLTFSSSLGNEVFYLLFYPYVAWNMDSVVVRRTSVVWCLCMYAGQATKDYLRWPRPMSPPVVRLETDFQQEFGMPSTHAMSATAIPFMLAYTIISRYEISPVLVVCVAVCWCLLVCSSRLYLGVHSVLDLVCGVIISLFIILLMVPHMKEFDMFQQSHPVAPLVILGISMALSTVCYPNQAKVYNTTKGDAVQIVSVSAGVALGTWINYQYGFTVDKGQLYQAKIVIPTVTMVIESLLRMGIGVVILAALYLSVGSLSVKFFSYIFNLEKPNKRHPNVEVAYKYVTYYVLGFAIIFLIPYTHFLLGLGRSAYYNEVQ